LYGLALSRAHGAAQNHLETKVLRLFDQRASVHARVAHLAGPSPGSLSASPTWN
jgi:hypothetical protein